MTCAIIDQVHYCISLSLSLSPTGRMKSLLICLVICFTFLPLALSNDLPTLIKQAEKCGTELRTIYNDACKLLGGKKAGAKLMPIEKKCVKIPEKLQKFPVSSIAMKHFLSANCIVSPAGSCQVPFKLQK